MDGLLGSVYRAVLMTRIDGHFTYRDPTQLEAARTRLGPRDGWVVDGPHLTCDVEVDWQAEDWNGLLMDLSEYASNGLLRVSQDGQPPHCYLPGYGRGYLPPETAEGMLRRHGPVYLAHPLPVDRLAWSPDGHWLAVALSDQFLADIWVWDLRLGQLAHQLNAREGESLGYRDVGVHLGFAGPDRLVAGGMDDVLRSFDLSTGRLTAWRDCKRLAAIGVGDGLVAVQTEDAIELFDGTTLAPERSFERWSSDAIRAMLIADGRLHISTRHQLEVLDLATGDGITSQYEDHVALAIHGQTFALAGRHERDDEEETAGGHILWYREQGEGQRLADGLPIRAVALAEDAVVLAREGTIEAYGRDGAPLWSRPSSEPARALAVRGKALAIGYSSGRVQLLDDYREAPAPTPAPPQEGLFLRDGSVLDQGRRYDLRSGRDLPPLPEMDYACVSSDGSVLVAQPEWQELLLLRADDGERLAKVEGPQLSQLSLMGSHLLGLDEDERPGVFDVGSGKRSHQLWTDEESQVQGLCGRDGRVLCWNEQRAELWTVDGQHVRTFEQPVEWGALGADGAV